MTFKLLSSDQKYLTELQTAVGIINNLRPIF